MVLSTHYQRKINIIYHINLKNSIRKNKNQLRNKITIP